MSRVLSPKWSSYITSPLLKTQGSVEVDDEKFKSWRLWVRTKKRIIQTQKDMNSALMPACMIIMVCICCC